MYKKLFLTALFLCVNSANLEADETATYAPKLTMVEALEIACEKAKEGGIRFELYEATVATYDFKDRYWSIIFRPKRESHLLGSSFGVQIFEGDELRVVLQRGA